MSRRPQDSSINHPDSHAETTRRIIRVTGIVQGVGFRPFVYRQADRLRLRGWVRNTSGSVEIDVEGPEKAIDLFLLSIRSEAPTLARIETVTAIHADPAGHTSFSIVESSAPASAEVAIPADVCTCDDCFQELDDDRDRRYAYPFTNCTNCGPRFTIIRRLPYDRPNTTMSAFPMCDDCSAEYRNPENRRFHTEPIACPSCGPSVWVERNGQADHHAPFEVAGSLIREGRIVAVKGLGGFHLACDACNDDAVRLLRSRKGRGKKPFAVMVKDDREAQRLCFLDASARSLLLSAQRPIVVARRKPGTDISESVAPNNNYLGLMLPYTPLHKLLFDHAAPALVMTSGNLAEEPLEFTNAGARERLRELADAFLMHNRDIHVPCDDSVVKPLPDGTVTVMRRSRGYVPGFVEIPPTPGCILGVGGEQKNTFCLAWDTKALTSQHIGDLNDEETFAYYEYAIDHFRALTGRTPEVIGHDLHPSYLSTQYAGSQTGVKLLGVQHHHAHIAACLAENGRTDRCIGLALDGTGFGTDGTIWGGEILIADFAGFERVGHLGLVRMPGGEAAIRDPRRMAMAYLYSAYGDGFLKVAEELDLVFSDLDIRIMSHQMREGLNSPLTSSAGRLCDAVAAAIGVCRERTYEGQPAVELEMKCDPTEDGSYAYRIDKTGGALSLDCALLFRQAVNDRISGVDVSAISARFHNGLVSMLAAACDMVRASSGLNAVALSGGVFQNEVICVSLVNRLTESGFEVLRHICMPPNDACISLGQVVVASALARD